MWKSRLSKHARLLVLVISVVGVTILTSLIRYLASPPRGEWADAHGRHSAPQVALLYITRGPMPLEPAWREFFESAKLLHVANPAGFQRRLAKAQLAAPFTTPSGTTAAAAVAVQTGGESLETQAAETRMTFEPAFASSHSHRKLQSSKSKSKSWSIRAMMKDDIIAQQSLYSVYVHTSPGFSFAPGNVFAGYEVPDRVQVMWGQHSMVEAERILLKAALQREGNQRFVLLSEHCLPLYPPGALYAQLVLENLSRLHACASATPEDISRRVLWRWSPEMASEHLSKQHWRKSSQWASLLRPHAQLAVEDTEVEPRFQASCFTYLPNITMALPPHVQKLLDAGQAVARRMCVSDEHYLPTLLAVHGLDAQTDCTGVLTHSDWTWPNWSPKKYSHLEVTAELVHKLRSHQWFQPPADTCDYPAMLASAGALFRRPGSWGLSMQDAWASFRPLPRACSLFARKFDFGALDAVIRQGQDCETGFGWSPLCA